MLVTVTDPLTGKVVVGAKVTASVDPINVHHYGNEFLCAQSDEAHVPCGTEMSGLLTDQKGQLHLIYWAPGVVRQASTVLRVVAQKACAGDACPARLDEGQKYLALQIKPYVIYEHTGELSKDEVEALVEIMRNPGLFSLANELAKEGFKVPFEEALKWLVGEEEEAELAVESIPDIFAEPLFGLFEATHVAIELHEQDELVAAFLQAVALPGIGLYDPPRESKAPAPPAGLFESAIRRVDHDDASSGRPQTSPTERASASVSAALTSISMAGNSSHSAFQAAPTSRRSPSLRPSSMGVKTSPRRSSERLAT